MASDASQSMCHQQVYSSNKVTDSFPAREPRRITGAHSLSLRQLLHIEQSVEDISDIFHRVDYILSDIDGSNTIPTMLPERSWEEFQHEFLRIAARCRNNFHEAVAIMDACRELLLTDADPPVYDSANGEFKTPEELLRTRAARGQSGSDDLRQLAKKIKNFRTHSDVVPAPPVHPSLPSHRIIPRYPQTVQYGIKLLLSFQSRISVRRHIAGLALVIRILLRRPWNNALSTTRRTTFPSRSPDAPPLVAEPEPAYPDSLEDDMERTAGEIESFADAWSKIADEIGRWADYLELRASSHSRASELGEGDVSFFNAIAAMWDAIMDMRHATLVRIHAEKPAVVI